MSTSVSLMSLLRSLVLDLDLGLDLELELDLDLELLWLKNGRIQIAKDIKKSGMIASAIQQIVNTDRAELKDFLNEVDKLHKTAQIQHCSISTKFHM
jgi:hypothetical protein